ncbi:GATOR complex protein Wdr59 isoform X1 [Anopheles darlingi]|uniref:GATOR complex protein Wdr59 isoform X1 n=1 Tax=Anopheles darlingi TaxID=43151 RepID=UPI0021001E9E|nr:GATOR complex protein Wdr59 isoform X1 [Anopheles darlingi]XP_049538040.1 GATOR complex protein Wdr59 isoform X1 [Anopheles darlingi]
MSSFNESRAGFSLGGLVGVGGGGGIEPICLQRKSAWVREYRDLQANVMSVDWTGKWILLAGRRLLALQSLRDYEASDGSGMTRPGEESIEACGLRSFKRHSKYEVTAAEWAICENSQEYCAIATCQQIEVVTWRSGEPTLKHSLRAHTRMITDIDWHSKVPHLLASCSIDTFTHLWDLRDPRKPVLSLSAVCMSGASQVGFNRVSGNLVATAHDGDLRIWDQRKGSCPMQYITAHLSRIHGINWSHDHETSLSTASQDGTVKYFDINNPRRAEKIITTSCPVWRARYTPFADGLVTTSVPQQGRGENSLLMWNNSKQDAPICALVGHTDVVLDFAWGRKGIHDPELITWSRDQTIRIWRIDEDVRKLCERYPTPDDDDGLIIEDGSGSSNTAMAMVGSTGGKPITSPKSPMREKQPSVSLQHEFSLLNPNIPHIDIEVLDPIKRTATVRISVNGYVIMLQVNFPSLYPNNGTVPEFHYCQGTSLDDALSVALMKVLRTTASQRVKKGRTCLEQCLRALVTHLKKTSITNGDRHLRLQSPRLEGALSSVLHDACVPFPKTSGVRFCQVGMLVTFTRPLNTKRIVLKQQQNTTPRALSALSGGYLGNVMGSQPILYAHRDPSTSSFYLPDRKSSRHRGSSAKVNVSSVHVYDVSKILYVSRELAENYIISTTNVAEMCRHNRAAAEKFGRADLVQCWSLAEMIAQPGTEFDPDDDMLCTQNPFAKSLLESLIHHFARIHDIQTAAMLCCAFGRHCPSALELSMSSSSSSKSINQSHLLSGHRKIKVNHTRYINSRAVPGFVNPSGSPYHTILPVDTSSSTSNNVGWRLAQQLKHWRSNSWSDSLDDFRVLGVSSGSAGSSGAPFGEINRGLLGDNNRYLYDNFRRSYAEMLYRWGLLVPRAKVLKFLSNYVDTPRCVEFVTECLHCCRVGAPACATCKKPVLYCSLCRLPVRGAANACLHCGHGGHTEHMRIWFERYDVCATGCGCQCLSISSKLCNL